MSTLRIGSLALGAVPRVVAAGSATEVAALGREPAADLLELRADLAPAPDPTWVTAVLPRLAAHRPVILTVRAAAEGGHPLDDAQRTALYRAGLPHAAAIDVEIASQTLVHELVPQARAQGCTVILSAHRLRATPSVRELLALVAQARNLGADIVKLATHASSLEDLRTLLEVTLEARQRGIVTLAMGPLGPLSRLVLPAAGSLLTYGFVGQPTAPSGQLPVAELAALVHRFFPAS